MNRQEAAIIIKAIGKHAIETHLTDPGDILDATVMAVQALVPKPDEVTGLARCNWCGPERIGWFSVQFWVRACYGKRKWMSVTQDWKKKVKYCPMCGRKLGVEE